VFSATSRPSSQHWTSIWPQQPERPVSTVLGLENQSPFAIQCSRSLGLAADEEDKLLGSRDRVDSLDLSGEFGDERFNRSVVQLLHLLLIHLEHRFVLIALPRGGVPAAVAFFVTLCQRFELLVELRDLLLVKLDHRLFAFLRLLFDRVGILEQIGDVRSVDADEFLALGVELGDLHVPRDDDFTARRRRGG
jgi:hypothetical protein